MFGDESSPIRHRVEQRPKRSVAAPIVISVEDTRIYVYGYDLKYEEKEKKEE